MVESMSISCSKSSTESLCACGQKPTLYVPDVGAVGAITHPNCTCVYLCQKCINAGMEARELVKLDGRIVTAEAAWWIAMEDVKKRATETQASVVHAVERRVFSKEPINGKQATSP